MIGAIIYHRHFNCFYHTGYAEWTTESCEPYPTAFSLHFFRSPTGAINIALQNYIEGSTYYCGAPSATFLINAYQALKSNTIKAIADCPELNNYVMPAFNGFSETFMHSKIGNCGVRGLISPEMSIVNGFAR